jgi:hypothetical protein
VFGFVRGPLHFGPRPRSSTHRSEGDIAELRQRIVSWVMPVLLFLEGLLAALGIVFIIYAFGPQNALTQQQRSTDPAQDPD